MKKKILFFFFRSSCSGHENTTESPPTYAQIQSHFEGRSQTSPRGLFFSLRKRDQSGSNRRVNITRKSPRDFISKSDCHNSTDGPALRRKRSMSSSGVLGVGSKQIFSSPRDQSRSSSSEISRDSSHPQHDPSLRCPTNLTPEKHTTKIFDIPASPNTHELGKSCTASKTRGLFSRLRKQEQSETGRVKSSPSDLFAKSDSHNSTDCSMSSSGFLGVGSGPSDFSSPTDQCRLSTSTISSEPSFRCWLRSNDILVPNIDREQEISRPKNSFQGNVTRSGNVDATEAEDETDMEFQRTYKKTEKYESEEQRLCEGVTDLAGQNVSFQREVSSFNERDTEWRSEMAYFKRQFKELNIGLEHMKDENQVLRKNLSELQDKCTVVQKQFEDKDKECKELHKSVTILLRTRSQSRMLL